MRSSRSAGRLGDEVLDLDEAVLVGQRELVRRHVGDRVLAERGEHELHARQRAERVAVGVLVRGEQEALGALELGEQQRARRGGAVAAHAPSSSSSSWIRSERSTELS